MNRLLNILPNSNLTRQLSLSISKNRKKNYYDSLGLTPEATQRDIKNAYFKLSKHYQPDINSGNVYAADRFRDISEAYDILGNLKARKLYDKGILTSNGLRDKSRRNDEPKTAKHKSASFPNPNISPLNKESKVSGKSRDYAMDKWTKDHYSETFKVKNTKREGGRVHMEDKISTKRENKSFGQIVGVLLLLMALGLIFSADVSTKIDQQSPHISDEKSD